MKARIRKSGEIRNFYPTTQSGYNGYVDEDGRWYYPSDLDFNLCEPEEEVTLSGWVCRDGDIGIRDAILYLFLKGEPFPDNDRPERIGVKLQMWRGANGLHLPSELFPSVTWDSDPLECTITIKPKKK